MKPKDRNRAELITLQLAPAEVLALQFLALRRISPRSFLEKIVDAHSTKSATTSRLSTT
jgi:hypothetical protein